MNFKYIYSGLNKYILTFTITNTLNTHESSTKRKTSFNFGLFLYDYSKFHARNDVTIFVLPFVWICPNHDTITKHVPKTIGFIQHSDKIIILISLKTCPIILHNKSLLNTDNLWWLIQQALDNIFVVQIGTPRTKSIYSVREVTTFFFTCTTLI